MALAGPVRDWPGPAGLKQLLDGYPRAQRRLQQGAGTRHIEPKLIEVLFVFGRRTSLAMSSSSSGIGGAGGAVSTEAVGICGASCSPRFRQADVVDGVERHHSDAVKIAGDRGRRSSIQRGRSSTSTPASSRGVMQWESQIGTRRLTASFSSSTRVYRLSHRKSLTVEGVSFRFAVQLNRDRHRASR